MTTPTTLHLSATATALLARGNRPGHGQSDRANGILARFQVLIESVGPRIRADFPAADIKQLGKLYLDRGSAGPWLRAWAAPVSSDPLATRILALPEIDVTVLEEIVAEKFAAPVKAIEVKPADIEGIRMRVGLTQTEAAGLVGISERSWRGYEAGKVSMPFELWDAFLAEIEGVKSTAREEWRSGPRKR